MAPNVGLGTQGPVERGWSLYLLSVTMVIVAGLFVAIRIGTTAARNRLGTDDYTIVASLLFSVLLSITEIEAVVNGYGRHAKDIPHEQVIIALKWFFGAQVMYKMVITLNKVSILCLYYRIFSVDAWFRYTSYGGIAFIVSSGIAYIIATIFQCTPIYGFWDKTAKDLHCVNSAPFWQSYAVLNIITDFAILALPISQVAKLRLPRMEKVGLIIIFVLGAFVGVTSIVRTTTLVLSAKDRDPTWGPIPATVWSVIEANSGIICACLPKLRRPLSVIFPCLLSKTYISTLTHQTDTRAYRLDSKVAPPPPASRSLSLSSPSPSPRTPVAFPSVWMPGAKSVSTWEVVDKEMGVDGYGPERRGGAAARGVPATFFRDGRGSSRSSVCQP